MSDRIYNFSAGPAVLPEPVIEKAQRALWSLGDSGIGVMEHSHRSPEFTEVIESAEARCRSVGGIPEGYRVLFLQGGASTQFFMIPMNLLGEGDTADYINTGSWSKKAIKEAKRFGSVHVAASSEDENFAYIPAAEAMTWSSAPAYVHMTGNNTIFGTEYAKLPAIPSGVPLVTDASSHIFSRPIDVARYGIIYAGAQKNLGPAGITLVIIRDELVEKGRRDLPTMLQYRTHAEADSMFNTPPTFAIFVLDEVLKWIADFGGLAALGEYNAAKAALLYDYLDESRAFRATARAGSRSDMNVCFRGRDEAFEAEFLRESKQRGFSGLKGHRSVGGMRASIYNAFPRAGVEKLVGFMKDFETKHR